MAESSAVAPAGNNGEENEMQALCGVHILNNHLTPREFFRTAYMWKFGKDIPPNSLNEDVEAFQYTGNLQPYAVDYLIHCYGVQ